MIGCTMIGRYLNTIGREQAIMIGMIFIIIQQGCLAYLATIEDANTFLLVSFIGQAIGGVGSGINSVSAMALVVANSPKKDREANIGYVEAFTGIGFLLGPLFGSFMFTLGGYSLPFLSSLMLYLISYPIVAYNLNKAKIKRLEDEFINFDPGSPRLTHSDISILELFSVPRFTFGIMSQSIVTGSVQFLAPSLSLHLQNYGYTPDFISLCFCIPSILYASIAPFMYLLTSRMPKRFVIQLGITLMGFGMFFVGTSKLMGFENDADFVLAGLCMIGVAAGMIAIPVLPEMLESIEEKEELGYDPDKMTDVISSLFVTSTGVGEAIGPIVSSLLIDAYGYTEAQDIYAVFLLSFAALYLLITFRQTNKIHEHHPMVELIEDVKF